ncbi:flavodoxin [Dethiosulfatarculus sandiegensis]|uniref:Flavodoxin n=1 Tax=Dethiosulfatarculus sandiegensis TaxID=1429043 RepID=A0A0D2GFJ4_9BACT|nr:flavodoxin [Dethiosulfatarculus sandiegensis]KIX13712.1 flavodoxin [Dethiosulfatarculus sandiegensis]
MKALILFGSTTGNTEYTAEVVQEVLDKNKVETTLLNAVDASLEVMEKDFGLFVFGCSTWGDDDIELQEDFEPLYEGMDKVSFDGKLVATFGCGDSTYTHFCGAVDAITEKAQAGGAKIDVSPLKIDGDPDDVRDEIEDWAQKVADLAKAA